MARPVIAVDVDDTVAPTAQAWVDWLNKISGKSLSLEDCSHHGYDLSKAYEDELPEGLDPYSFFCNDTIYDTIEPLKGSVKWLRYLRDYGCDVVFVTAATGRFAKSSEGKERFLNRYFPFADGYVITEDKSLVKCDVLIDDRVKHLLSMPDHVLKVWKEVPFDHPPGGSILNGDIDYVFGGWDEGLVEFIKGFFDGSCRI